MTLKPAAIAFFILLFFNQLASQVVINEFMADNKSTIQDQDGDYSDWIELYNNYDYPVNLINYSLSDNGGNLRKWLFPEIIIPAQGHILVFASGKNRTNEEELHTNFSIAASGEALFLSDNYAALIDQFYSDALSSDESFGRFPDGSSNWQKSIFPTPGISNNAVNHLSLSSAEGFYTWPFSLVINSPTGDTVHYTTDGSEPNLRSAIFTDSIFLDYKYDAPNYFSGIPSSPTWESPTGIVHKAHIVRFASFKNGTRTSKVYTHTFLVDSTIFQKYYLPVISLVTDEKNLFDLEKGIYIPGIWFDPEDSLWSGNYYQKGSEWERPVHIEFFENYGSKGFSQDAGLRIHGFKSRYAAQKSLRLYARKEYGERYFNYRLFPQKEHNLYKRFILRTTMSDWFSNTVIKDVLAHEIAKDLDLEYQDYKPVVVYLNGEYWGIHTLRDRIDEWYIAYTTGYDKDFVDIIEGNYNKVDAGSNGHYIELAEFIVANDLSYDMNYEYVLTQIDIGNFIDYYVAQMFFANVDWPFNNQRLWRPQTPDGKWRWILFDVDAGFGDVNTDMFAHSLTYADLEYHEMSVSTFLFSNMLKNENFVELFLRRFAEVLHNEFSVEVMTEKLNRVKEQYIAEMPHHISRWNVPESFSGWENDIENHLLSFIRERPCVVANNISEFFGITDFGFECNPPTSTLPAIVQRDIMVAPNPNRGSFYLLNNSPEIFLNNITLSDFNGRIIHSENNVFLGAGERKHFNLEGIPAGIYILRYTGAMHSETKTLVVIP
jgi:hypothetical protein